MKLSRSLCLLLLSLLCSDLPAQEPPLDLAGTWAVQLDAADEGLDARWFARPLETAERVRLPGTLAEAGLGHPFDPQTGRYSGADRPYLAWPSAGYTDETRADELGALVPSHLYLGAAWYERDFTIPAAAVGRRLRLHLERVKWTSRAWVDGVEITGEATDSLHTPHVYAFTLTEPGAHRLTLRIDNRPPINIGLAGHGYGMETEPIWHGVAGRLGLAVLEPVRVGSLRLDPAADRRSVGVRLALAHDGVMPEAAMVTLRVRALETGGVLGETTLELEETIAARVELDRAALPWDEFAQPRYELVWTIRAHERQLGSGSRSFAFRALASEGNRLLLNGTPLFLRGNLDCAIHPGSLTPPPDRDWWARVLGIHKRAGFNHIRFHTWCPPEVAFEVADELGLLLQVETPFWVDDWIHDTPPFPPTLGTDPAVEAWVLAESRRILDAYGHHPSLAFFCLGNEFGNRGSDWGAIDGIVDDLRSETSTVLISGTTARKTVPGDEYWVTHRTALGGIRGVGPAHTDWDFSSALAETSVPTISHETGQRQSWPDYDALLPVFTGAVTPANLVRLRDRAETAGITDHRARAEASARFAHLLYKAEHEAMRRTPNLAGYQLLMLHDFTGQGEALVGLLDPFYREKPGISLAMIAAWNGPTVPLARFPASTWTTDDSLPVSFEVAHQGPGTLEDPWPIWILLDRTHNKAVASGSLDACEVQPGSRTPLGSISVPLAGVKAPAQLMLSLTVGMHTNTWPIWVYPPPEDADPPETDLHITRRLDDDALAALARGETVLLLFHKGTGERFRQTRFLSTYWTGAWGWGTGLGLMCDPRHPALAGFPNKGHSDWQWRGLAEGGTCIALDPAQADRATIIEQISNFHAPKREAFLVEARVGPGRLLACGFDLEYGLESRHAARAFHASLLAYAVSDDFRPALALTPAEAAETFATPDPLDATATASSEAPGYPAANAIDGDPDSFWHTPWGAIEPDHPHELVIECKEAKELQGVRLKARPSNPNGRLAVISLYVSDHNGDWGEPVLDHAQLANTDDWQTLVFGLTEGRFMRLVTHREVAGHAFASLAELEPITAASPRP